MWFKKKSVLQGEHHYDTEKSADGITDMRTTYKSYTNTSSSITNSGLPSAADAGTYFYLPGLGLYTYGRLYSVGLGYYWSSSANPLSHINACSLNFLGNSVEVTYSDRYFGFRVEPTFE